jgi:magnesium chelatase subunit D
LEKVHIRDELIQVVCEACVELKVDGMRPDLVITKTAITMAAYENKTEVDPEHILKAAELALNHRTRENGFLEPATSQEIRNSFVRRLQEGKQAESESNRTADSVKGKRSGNEPEAKEEKRKLLPPFGLRRFTKLEKELAKAKIGSSDSSNLLMRSSNLRKGRFLLDSEPEKGGSSASLPLDANWSDPKVTRGARFLDGFRETKLPSL